MQLNTSGISEYISELKETANLLKKRLFGGGFGTWV
jgi:hypothetical protein